MKDKQTRRGTIYTKIQTQKKNIQILCIHIFIYINTSISSAEADREIGGRGWKNTLGAFSSKTLFKSSL